MTLGNLRPWKRCRRRSLMLSLILLALLPVACPNPTDVQYDTSLGPEISSVFPGKETEKTQRPTQPESQELSCLSPAINEFPEDFMTQLQREKGGVAVHIFIVMYLCAFLGLVCDRYFVPSLELICDILHVPSDIAGATFMAIGTSAPELFSSVIGSFITEGDIGVGAIVGSAIFNVIGITGIVGLTLWKTEVPIDWYPVSRDCFAYTLSVFVLMFVLQDNTVDWYEAVIMIVMFFLYVLLMCFNGKLEKFFTKQFESARKKWAVLFESKKDESPNEKSPLLAPSHVVIIEPPKRKKSVRFADDEEGRKSFVDSNHNIIAQVMEDAQPQEESMWRFPEGSPLRKCCWILLWPAALLLHLTVPDCRKPRWKRFYLLTFFMSVAWIAASTYLSVWMVTVIGYTLGIPDAISGITLLAVGTSVPEIISSILVVRNGYGNMAICNLLGSNVFNIVFCLGAPWLLKTTLMSVDGTIHINSAALTYMALTLLSTVAVLYGAFILTKWKISWKIGIICVIMYLAFIGLACFFELGLLAGTTLPTCAA